MSALPALAAASRAEPAFARAILEAIAAAERLVPLPEVEAALAAQDATTAWALLEPALARLERVDAPWAQTIAAAAEAAQAHGPRTAAAPTAGTFALAFNRTAPPVLAWIASHALDLAKYLGSDARLAIRGIIDQVFRNQIPFRSAARLIKAFLGLTPRQATAVQNLRDRLASSAGQRVQAGSRTIRVPEAGADQEFIDRHALAYTDRLKRDRARTIARTESIRAANEGQLELWRQAVEEGLLTGKELRVWIATDEGTVNERGEPIETCDLCNDLDGEAVPLDEEFSAGTDPPLHPNCRCTVGLEITGSTPRFESARILAFDPSQPRVPAGDPHGGQWTGGAASATGDAYGPILTDASGRPRIYYHGTRRPRESFSGPRLFPGGPMVRAVYLTPDPAFASMVAGSHLGATVQAFTVRAKKIFDAEKPEHLAIAHDLGILTRLKEPGRATYHDLDVVSVNKLYEAGFDGHYEYDDAMSRVQNLAVYRPDLQLAPALGRRAGRAARYDPDQPRVPRGYHEGGQWSGQGAPVASGTVRAVLASLEEGRPATIAHQGLLALLERARKEESAANLALLTVDALPIFAGGLGVRRVNMPQIPKEFHEAFLQELDDKAITVQRQRVSPAALLPSQDEISARNVADRVHRFEKGQTSSRPILISRDDYVLDGHHRWAAVAAIDAARPDARMRVPVIRLGVDHDAALSLMRDFVERHGIKAKSIRDNAFNPDQRRAPKGTAEGGQWVAEGGGYAGLVQRVKWAEVGHSSIGLITPQGDLINRDMLPEGSANWLTHEDEFGVAAASVGLRYRRDKDVIIWSDEPTQDAYWQVENYFAGRGIRIREHVPLWDPAAKAFDPAKLKAAYRRDQKRVPKGSPEAGQWVTESGTAASRLDAERSARGPWSDHPSADTEYSIGQILADGTIESVNWDKDIRFTTHAEMFGRLQDYDKRFRFRLGEVSWDEPPSVEDFFLVDDYYRSHGVEPERHVADYKTITAESLREYWEGRGDLLRAARFDPAQPRDPAGTPTGGQWTAEQAAAFLAKPRSERIIEERDRLGPWSERPTSKSQSVTGQIHDDGRIEVVAWDAFGISVPHGLIFASQVDMRQRFRLYGRDLQFDLVPTLDDYFAVIDYLDSHGIKIEGAAEGASGLELGPREITRYWASHKAERAARFDPNQPRDPKGTPTGGQWTAEGSVPTYDVPIGPGGRMVRVTIPPREEDEASEPGPPAAEPMPPGHPASPGIVVFHGTSTKALKGIKQEGIRPGRGRGADELAGIQVKQWEEDFLNDAQIAERHASVFITRRLETARQFARYAVRVNPGSKPVILVIKVPKSAQKRVSRDPASDVEMQNWMVQKGIPPSWIKGTLDDDNQVRALALGGDLAEPEDLTLYFVLLCDEDPVGDEEPRTAAGWDEAAHPREPAGTPEGGQFREAPSGHRYTADLTDKDRKAIEGKAAYSAKPQGSGWVHVYHTDTHTIVVDPKGEARRTPGKVAGLTAINDYKHLTGLVPSRAPRPDATTGPAPLVEGDLRRGRRVVGEGGKIGTIVDVEGAKTSKGWGVARVWLRFEGEDHDAEWTPDAFLKKFRRAAASPWDESKHPRDPAGTATGGHFTDKGAAEPTTAGPSANGSSIGLITRDGELRVKHFPEKGRANQVDHYRFFRYQSGSLRFRREGHTIIWTDEPTQDAYWQVENYFIEHGIEIGTQEELAFEGRLLRPEKLAAAAAWDESKHPREPAGTPEGGHWTDADGGGVPRPDRPDRPGANGETMSVPLPPVPVMPWQSEDGPMWVGPVAESGLWKGWGMKGYREFEKKVGLGPCGFVSTILRERGLGQIAYCNAEYDVTKPTFPHFVIIDKNGAIVDRTNPGMKLRYFGVQLLKPDELPDLVDGYVDDILPWIRTRVPKA